MTNGFIPKPKSKKNNRYTTHADVFSRVLANASDAALEANGYLTTAVEGRDAIQAKDKDGESTNLNTDLVSEA